MPGIAIIAVKRYAVNIEIVAANTHLLQQNGKFAVPPESEQAGLHGATSGERKPQ